MIVIFVYKCEMTIEFGGGCDSQMFEIGGNTAGWLRKMAVGSISL